MMGEMMMFPGTPSEFIDLYAFKDKQEVYTNGSELIQVFRVKQMLEHYFPEKVRAEAIQEFAEKLKGCVMKYTEYDEGGWDSTIYAVKVDDIYRLVKEMTEEPHAEENSI